MMPPRQAAPLSLDHLFRMSGRLGLIQHSRHAEPDPATGYTTDDNARALMAALGLWAHLGQPRLLELAERYARFLERAQRPDGTFVNFFGPAGERLEEVGSEDSFGRALWGCGTALAAAAAAGGALGAAGETWLPSLEAVLQRAAAPVRRLRSPRAQAFAVLGLVRAVEAGQPHTSLLPLVDFLAAGLVALYRRHARPGWHWFEEVMTYSNGVLPLALFEAHRATGRREYLVVALDSLAFLVEAVLWQGRFVRVVGNRGWWGVARDRAWFDEQPVDAAKVVLAAAGAWRVTAAPEYLRLAETAFAWFLGRNHHGLPLYDAMTGGCRDGLTPEGLNLNQGAESLLAYLLAYLELESLAQESGRTLAQSGA